MPERIEDLFFVDLESHPIVLVPDVEYVVEKVVVVRLKYGGMVERRHLVRRVHEALPVETPQVVNQEVENDQPEDDGTAEVKLFKRSGRYYTTERWRVPKGVNFPSDMRQSPDFRRIDMGPVLVTSERWGFPAILVGQAPEGIPEWGTEG